jgi:hypothetical protein
MKLPVITRSGIAPDMQDVTPSWRIIGFFDFIYLLNVSQKK